MRGELSLLVGVDLDAQPASFTFNDVDGAAVAGADLVEQRLTRDSELASSLIELEVASWDVRDESLADLVSDRDPPRGVRRGLLGWQEAFGQPAANRLGAHAELPGGAGGAAGMPARSRIPATRAAVNGSLVGV